MHGGKKVGGGGGGEIITSPFTGSPPCWRLKLMVLPHQSWLGWCDIVTDPPFSLSGVGKSGKGGSWGAPILTEGGFLNSMIFEIRKPSIDSTTDVY